MRVIQWSEHTHRVLDLAWQEADRFGHHYLGPEHLVLGVLCDEGSGAARILEARGVDLATARAALGRLADRGVMAGPRPGDAELLGMLGIDLEAIRRSTEQAFGGMAVGWAIREATRARGRGGGRVPRTPLGEPPMLISQALQHAGEQARALGLGVVGPELLLLGVVTDIRTPWPRCMRTRWRRQLHASVGLPEGYRGAAGPLLQACGVDLEQLGAALLAELRGGRAVGAPAPMDEAPMGGSGSGGGKLFGRFSEPAHRVLDLAREEAERFGHRYLGPEHVLLGMLAEGQSRVTGVLRTHGVDLAATRTALTRLANRGVVPGPRPSDAELLGSLGIDLDAVRRDTEQTFGFRAVGEATWRVTRRRGWRGCRVVWTPLCGPPFFAKRAVQLASEQAHVLGHGELRPEHLLLGVLEDARQPSDTVRGSRRHRQITAHVGLPEGYRGAAGFLLAALGVDLDQLRDAVAAGLGGVQR